MRLGENALYRLPGGIVARVSRVGQFAAAAREVAVARWLEANHVPAVPSQVGMYVISPTNLVPGASAVKLRRTRSGMPRKSPCSVVADRHGLGWQGTSSRMSYLTGDVALRCSAAPKGDRHAEPGHLAYTTTIKLRYSAAPKGDRHPCRRCGSPP